MYGKEDMVPRINDATFRVGYGLSSGQQSDMDIVEQWLWRWFVYLLKIN